jgi:hypothetical protein
MESGASLHGKIQYATNKLQALRIIYIFCERDRPVFQLFNFTAISLILRAHLMMVVVEN